MTISQTPNGAANRCVICGKDIALDLACPYCANAQTFPGPEAEITLAAFKTLDPEVLDRIRAIVRANSLPRLVLNFDQVKVTNSAGYARFMLLVKEARKAGAHIVISRADPLIQEMFKLTRIDGELEIQ
jgi:hypothetical protein